MADTLYHHKTKTKAISFLKMFGQLDSFVLVLCVCVLFSGVNFREFTIIFHIHFYAKMG